MRLIAFDLLRLFRGPLSPAPRGIDRVDLGYALHLFKDRSIDVIGVLPTPIGPRWFERDHVLEYESFFNRMWGESIDPSSDAAYVKVRQSLISGQPLEVSAPATASPNPTFMAFWRYVAMMGEARWSIGKSLRTLPMNTTYLNIGQIGLSRPWALEWLKRRPDMTSVFMMHDVIPLTHPDLVTAENRNQHERFMQNAIQYADLLLAPSLAAQSAIEAELQSREAAHLKVRGVPLPINDVFRRSEKRDADLASKPYFLVCGAIETRKNQLLLLRVWKQLVLARGKATPRLVIAGSLERGADNVMTFLRENPDVGAYIVFALDLSTVGVRNLMASARAVLTPSFAEGFGLPPIEALATGTPSIASDIPSHREAGNGFVQLLDPNDDNAWHDAIAAMLDDPQRPIQLRAAITSFEPRRWEAHVSLTLEILDKLPAKP